jgi:hypothetical protein
VAAVAALAFTMVPRESRADFTVGADLGVPIPVDLPGADAGFGFDGRLGSLSSFGPVDLTTELKGGYYAVANGGVARILGGARLGIGNFIQPGVYGHLGYGGITSAGGGGGFHFDAGGYLDLRLPLVSVGVHVDYNHILLNPGDFKWVGTGLHAALTF